MKTSLFELVVS